MITKHSPVKLLLRWREKNPELYKQKRLAGIRNSQKLKNAARKNALSRIGVFRLRSPQNVIYEFKNLAKFLRDHSELFDPKDLKQYYHPNPHRRSTDRCVAYKVLLSLKPYKTDGSPKSRVSGSWKGWRWYASKDVEEIG
jgi:hypothetical protein